MKLKPNRAKYGMYLAVLPKYRLECFRMLRKKWPSELRLFVSDAHLDSTVKTGLPIEWYDRVRIARIGNKAFVQYGNILNALSVENLIVDLNPRSITAWVMLLLRKQRNVRTLVWGHIHPQAGASSNTASLRLFMRKLADGTISYTYTDRARAEADLPSQEVWVAPNSIYNEDAIQPIGKKQDLERNEILYVGRLEPAKKVDLLIRALPIVMRENPHIRLRLVGSGSESNDLKDLAANLGVADRVTFSGWVDDLESLTEFYAKAICSASPGFAGLGLTQSLGFGIPMLVADNERHSPEIELADTGGVRWFTSDDPSSLAKTVLEELWPNRSSLPDERLSAAVRGRYSAEAMASGLASSLCGLLPEGTQYE